MKIAHLTLAALLLAPAPLASLTFAAEEAVAEEKEAAADPLETLKANPNNVDAINNYLQSTITPAMELADTDPKAAVAKLEQVKETMSKMKPTEERATAFFEQVDRMIPTLIERIELKHMSSEKLRAAIAAAPQDAEAINKYNRKVMMDLSEAASTDWEKAEAQMAEEKAYLEKLNETAETDDVKAAIVNSVRMLDRIAPVLERQRKLAEMIGKPAAPLTAEAWVNGAPLTDDELKGKVVLLDFFAIWCGPCIMTFPHLRELHDEYADKGLEIIGVTGYYNYDWNAERNSPEPAQGDVKVTHEAEQAMLQKFAEKYELKHVFAVDPERTLSQYYGVSGIPHMVLIDKEGKVALVKVGSGDANAKAIEAKVKELLGEG